MRISQPVAMLAIACMLQNVATGTSYGSYGVILNDLVAEFGVNRSTASLGLAIVALVAGLSGPLVGRLVDHWSLRFTVFIGLVLGAAGLTLAGIAQTFTLFLLAFSLIAGLGGALCGILPASALAGRWFPRRTGLAVAIANLAILIAVGPPIYAWVVVNFGWRALMFALSALFLLALVPTLWVKDRPVIPATATVTTAPVRFRFSDVCRQRDFWMVTVAMGMLFGSAIALSSHVVAFTVERGVAITTASWLLSINGIFAMVGGLLFGSISDRLGALPTLAANAGLACFAWLMLGISTTFPTIAACAVLLGLCGGGLLAPLGAYIARQYGAHAFGSALGLITQLILPMTFGGAILAGALYDISGSYRLPFNIFAGLCALSCVLFLQLTRRRTSSSIPLAGTLPGATTTESSGR